jgi:hypothetical protein
MPRCRLRYPSLRAPPCPPLDPARVSAEQAILRDGMATPGAVREPVCKPASPGRCLLADRLAGALHRHRAILGELQGLTGVDGVVSIVRAQLLTGGARICVSDDVVDRFGVEHARLGGGFEAVIAASERCRETSKRVAGIRWCMGVSLLGGMRSQPLVRQSLILRVVLSALTAGILVGNTGGQGEEGLGVQGI